MMRSPTLVVGPTRRWISYLSFFYYEAFSIDVDILSPKRLRTWSETWNSRPESRCLELRTSLGTWAVDRTRERRRSRRATTFELRIQFCSYGRPCSDNPPGVFHPHRFLTSPFMHWDIPLLEPPSIGSEIGTFMRPECTGEWRALYEIY